MSFPSASDEIPGQWILAEDYPSPGIADLLWYALLSARMNTGCFIRLELGDIVLVLQAFLCGRFSGCV